jgi:hypothetical protein
MILNWWSVFNLPLVAFWEQCWEFVMILSIARGLRDKETAAQKHSYRTKMRWEVNLEGFGVLLSAAGHRRLFFALKNENFWRENSWLLFKGSKHLNVIKMRFISQQLKCVHHSKSTMSLSQFAHSNEAKHTINEFPLSLSASEMHCWELKQCARLLCTQNLSIFSGNLMSALNSSHSLR